jgi:NodT family efflux transporter outer membrane factor (OMF) lipoprotein
MTNRRAIPAAAWLLLLGGCAVGPDYRAPQQALPESFAAATPQAMAPSTVDPTQWWKSLGDAELDSLVERAVKANPEVLIALDRLQEARTEEAVVIGEALPEADASGAKAAGTGSDLTRGRVGAPLHSADSTAGIKHITEAFGFDAGWEIDLFGAYRRAIEASRTQAEAAAEARNAVLVTVIADVARAYFDLRSLQMQVAVITRGIATADQTLQFVQARYDRGITNELDVTLARRESATLKGQLAPLNARLEAAKDGLAILLGEFPETLTKELEQPGALPQFPPAIAPGLPPDLLRRRPDIREAERQLAAATARIGVATAALFPHIAVTAGAGVQGPDLTGGLTHIWSAGPMAYWPLFDFGTLDGLIDIADLKTHEQLVTYKTTVQQAVRDVDSAVSAYAAEQDRLRNLNDALAASQRSVSLATQRYERGLTDFLNVLDAERQEYELESQYAVAQQATGDQFVALAKGLGGGWESYQAVPPIRQPMPALVAAAQRLLSPGDSDGQGPP